MKVIIYQSQNIVKLEYPKVTLYHSHNISKSKGMKVTMLQCYNICYNIWKLQDTKAKVCHSCNILNIPKLQSHVNICPESIYTKVKIYQSCRVNIIYQNLHICQSQYIPLSRFTKVTKMKVTITPKWYNTRHAKIWFYDDIWRTVHF